MIRGHRRKGFKDPPKPNGAEALTDIPNLAEEAEETQQKQQSHLSTEKNRDSIIIRNKRLFDSFGNHDPKNALLPAKLRHRGMNRTPTEYSFPESSSTSHVSPPSRTIQQTPPTIMNSKPEQLDTQDTNSANTPPATKRCRIKITPKRGSSAYLPQNENECPEIPQHTPAFAYPSLDPSVPNVYNPQISVSSENHLNFGMSIYCDDITIWNE